MQPCIRSAAARVLLWVIGASLFVLMLGRREWISLPGEVALALMVLLVITSSLFWWVWVDGTLRGHAPTWFRAVLTLYTVIMLLPFAMAFPGVRHLWGHQPTPVIMWVMIWYSVTLLNACAILCVYILRCPLRLLGNLRVQWRASDARVQKATDPVPAERNQTRQIPRRAVLGWMTTAGSLAMVGAGMRMGYSQNGRFQIRRVRLALPRCPDRLRGLTISHLSDLHVGRPLRPEYLPAIVDATNKLKSDLVIVTGDIVDCSLDFLPAAADAIARLEHRHGRFLIMGNHDLIESGARFVGEMTRREPGFMCDEHTVLTIGGEKLQVAGLRWAHADQSDGRVTGYDKLAAIALLGANHDLFTIAMAHHPHAFDALAARGVDLTLSGHTHGGQFKVPVPGTHKAINAGDALFKYTCGEYRKGTPTLLVNAGIGNWFPVRVNAPAEIVQIQLV